MDYAKPETIRPALHGVERIFLVAPPIRDLPALEANFIREVRRLAGSTLLSFPLLVDGNPSSRAGIVIQRSTLKRRAFPVHFFAPNG